jgi:glycosyltransferase involved in cell wall biosynthesis
LTQALHSIILFHGTEPWMTDVTVPVVYNWRAGCCAGGTADDDVNRKWVVSPDHPWVLNIPEEKSSASCALKPFHPNEPIIHTSIRPALHILTILRIPLFILKAIFNLYMHADRKNGSETEFFFSNTWIGHLRFLKIALLRNCYLCHTHNRTTSMISVVIIAFNEERNIERVLRSVQGLTDDIAVVDSGSTDRTCSICRDYGVRVIQHEWEGYSATKNFGNSQAHYPWILSLDADEALSPRLRESIVQHLSGDLPQNRTFSFNRLTNYCGTWVRHSGWYPDTKVRIWHRDFGRWEGYIHEKLVFKGQPDMVHLKGDLLHYSFYTREDYRQQMEKYARMSAEELFRAGKRVSILKQRLAPGVRFLRDYLFRGGFLDGPTGLEVCLGNARSVRLKYAMLRQLRATGNR